MTVLRGRLGGVASIATAAPNPSKGLTASTLSAEGTLAAHGSAHDLCE